MRRLALLLAFGASSCGSGSTRAPTTPDEQISQRPTAVEEELFKPTYERTELDAALKTERAALAAAEQRVRELEDGDYDALRAAQNDAAVRQRFVAALEACAANGRACPPRLDDPAWTFDIEANVDPKLDTTLRFDVASWQKVSAELFGRACACRTLACVDSMFVAIERLETRPMPDVQADEAASLSITRARECLYRLRGLRSTPRAVAIE
jgi:hypothetical protein